MNLKNIRQRAILELSNSDIKSAIIDVDILLQYILDKNDVFIFSHPDFPLTNSQYQQFRRLIRKRKTGYPIAYLVGYKEFFGLDFIVNKNVLIPRPETELLVELVIKNLELRAKNLEKLPPSTLHPQIILDIGTGCGNIIISLAKSVIPNSEFLIRYIASDISEKALQIAKLNAKKHNLESINFYKSDLFSNKRLPKCYDLILANLPYVPNKSKKLKVKGKNDNEEIDFEPQNAIFAEDNGTSTIKDFLNQTKDKLNANGMILLETDPRNIQQIKKYALKFYNNVQIIKDLSGRERFLKVLHN